MLKSRAGEDQDVSKLVERFSPYFLFDSPLGDLMFNIGHSPRNQGTRGQSGVTVQPPPTTPQLFSPQSVNPRRLAPAPQIWGRRLIIIPDFHALKIRDSLQYWVGVS